MKKLGLLLLTILLSLVCFNAYALKTSKFYPTFETDDEFQGNQLAIYFGWRGEEAYKYEFEFEIDNKMVEVLQIVPGDTFDVDYTSSQLPDGKKSYHLTVESDTIYNESISVAVVLKLKDDFKVKKSTEMKVTKIFAYSEDDQKYRNEGYYIKFKREGKNNMLSVRTDISAQSNRERVINAILPFVIVGVALAFLIIIVILLIPRRKTEDRRSKVNAQLDPENYPIPGVGPLPKIKKKRKVDKIEPEEKVIQPLREFLAKSDDVNEELKNRDLEVDKAMFKDNPTKEGETGLTNVNPLAFDDGEAVDAEEPTTDDNDDDIETL